MSIHYSTLGDIVVPDIILPQGQSWLIQRMQKLHYQSNNKGVCFGISCMIIQATLVNDFHKFYPYFLTTVK